MRHLRKTWKTAAVMREYRRPMTALLKSQKDRTRICASRKIKMGIKADMSAEATMGMISLRSGYANCG